MDPIIENSYYIDINSINEICSIGGTKENPNPEINILKYEMVKMCVETLLDTYPEKGDIDMLIFNPKKLSFPDQVAFNTLTINDILKKTNEQ